MRTMSDATQAAGELATLLLRAEAERDEARRENVDLRAQVSAERASLIGCQRERDAWRKECETLRSAQKTDREMLDNASLALLSLSGGSPKRQCLHAAYMSPERKCDLPCMACSAYRTVTALREGIRLYRRRHGLAPEHMQRSRAWEAEHGHLVPDEKTEEKQR